MKNKILLFALAALICSGCNSAPAGTTAASTTAAQTTAQTTARTSAEKTTDTPQTSTTAAEAAAQTTGADSEQVRTEIRYSVIDGNTALEMPLYEEDAEKNDNGAYYFDYAYICPAQGIYDDSDLHPDAFDFDELSYSGDMKLEPPEECQLAETGGEVCGARVRSAQSVLQVWEDHSELMSMALTYEGEFEFTGIFCYFAGDDYMISAGDMRFYPDGSIAGFPLPAPSTSHHISPRFMPNIDAPELAMLSEFGGFSVGNTISGNSGIYDLTDTGAVSVPLSDEIKHEIGVLIGTGTEDVYAKVKVTLSDITAEWSEQFGMARTRANLVSIERV